MKRQYLISLILAVTSANAQSVSDLPSCSLSCFADAVGQTSCEATDYTCQCTTENAATIKASVTSCLGKSTCSLADLQKIQSWSNTFCPNIQSSAATASTAAAPSTSSNTRTSPSSNTIPTENAASITQVSSTSLPPTMALTSVKSVPTTFGAGTDGTNWGNLSAKPSSANRGPAFEAVTIILTSVAALVLAFRFFARLYTKNMRQVVKGIGLDEWFALIALLITAGVTADVIVGVKYGMGQHMSSATTGSDLVNMLKLVYIFVILITASFSTIKISILLLYLRMSPERSHHTVCYICLGFVASHTIAALIGGIFQCTPIHAYWQLGNPLQNPHCFDILAFDGFNSAWSLMEDVVIWALPIPVVWNLKVPFTRKSGLYGLIAVSFISVICAIVRMAALVVWMRSSDISWNYLLLPFLSNMESCVAIMTSSVPAIYPLFRRGERERTWSNPPPPKNVKIEEPDHHEKSWESQDSTDGTAVPSTAQTDRSSKRWSFLSRGSEKEKKLHEGGRHMTTIKSEGPRTELKSMFEVDEEGKEIIPGLPK